MKKLNYFQRKEQQTRRCNCDENHWCNLCITTKFVGNNSMLFRGKTVRKDIAELASGIKGWRKQYLLIADGRVSINAKS